VTDATFTDLGQILVIIPTFNELESLPVIIGRVRASVPEAYILVADDNSPDGTGKLADEIAT
jgi:dolichol-phosphate mannosyltransferase